MYYQNNTILFIKVFLLLIKKKKKSNIVILHNQHSVLNANLLEYLNQILLKSHIFLRNIFSSLRYNLAVEKN